MYWLKCFAIDVEQTAKFYHLFSAESNSKQAHVMNYNLFNGQTIEKSLQTKKKLRRKFHFNLQNIFGIIKNFSAPFLARLVFYHYFFLCVVNSCEFFLFPLLFVSNVAFVRFISTATGYIFTWFGAFVVAECNIIIIVGPHLNLHEWNARRMRAHSVSQPAPETIKATIFRL